MWHKTLWRGILITQALGITEVFAESLHSHILGNWMGHTSLCYVSMALTTLIVLGVTLRADALVSRGASAWLVYGVNIFLVFFIAFVVAGSMEQIYYFAFNIPRAAALEHRWVFVGTAEGEAVTCVFWILIFINRRTVERMMEFVKAAEASRKALEEQVLASELAAQEAQVDPEDMCNALADIRGRLERGSADADAKLDEMVARIRSVLSRSAMSSGGIGGGA